MEAWLVGVLITGAIIIVFSLIVLLCLFLFSSSGDSSPATPAPPANKADPSPKWEPGKLEQTMSDPSDVPKKEEVSYVLTVPEKTTPSVKTLSHHTPMAVPVTGSSGKLLTVKPISFQGHSQSQNYPQSPGNHSSHYAHPSGNNWSGEGSDRNSDRMRDERSATSRDSFYSDDSMSPLVHYERRRGVAGMRTGGKVSTTPFSDEISLRSATDDFSTPYSIDVVSPSDSFKK